ncbi:MAG: disulfide bond formation protein DsbA, partial [Cellulomonadaceae bacterium]|nr:disulfide bond formation protein DsbA [Cellulomonadaceae bacterium]
EFSTRSAVAAAAVADGAPESFIAFNDAMFANQPEENTTGLSDDEIAQLALDAGISQDVVDTFTERAADQDWLTFSPFVAALTAQSTADLEALGSQMQTPTIVLDGALLDTETYNWSIEGQLAAAIEAAAAA